jgi:hypothetical protein
MIGALRVIGMISGGEIMVRRKNYPEADSVFDVFTKFHF